MDKMDKKDWLNTGFYVVLILIMDFCTSFTSGFLLKFVITLVLAIIGNFIHKKFIKPRL